MKRGAFIWRRARPVDVRTVAINMSPACERDTFASGHFADKSPAGRRAAVGELLVDGLVAPETPLILYALCREAGWAEQGFPCAVAGAGMTRTEVVRGHTRKLGAMIWLATLEWPSIAISTHHWWRTWFAPNVLADFDRVETSALADPQTSRWLGLAGFTPRGAPYPVGGDSFVTYAWEPSNFVTDARMRAEKDT